MSKFFQNLDEEHQETKTKAREIIEKSQEKLSKRETKFKELQDKIIDVKNSGKNFEKNFKKFINEIKKYVSYFENNTVPDFLSSFLENDDRIRSSKPMSALCDEFLRPFNTSNEPVVVSKKTTNKKAKDLNSILLIENDQEKEPELVDFLEKCSDESLKSEIYIALFSIYLRMKNYLKMIEIFRKMNLNLDNPQMKGVIKNLDIYLGKISTLIENKDIGIFFDLLNYLRNSNFPIDQSVVQKRELEIEYFVLNKSPENIHPLFHLLYLVRQNNWSAAFNYFNDNQNIFDLSRTSSLILGEFGDLAIRNQSFQLAFSILSKVFKSYPSPEMKPKLYALCVILNRSITGDELFTEFVEEFKKFESNYCCLKSNDSVTELYRAFYFINILDYNTSANIIEETTGIQAYDFIRDNVLKLYAETYQVSS